jgi:release factor glutamine methyltransferase
VTVVEALGQAITQLQAASDSPRADAEWLLAHATGRSRAQLLARPESVLAEVEHSAFTQAVAQRMQGMPVAYLLGEQGFWSLSLQVTPAVLIPRPETEGLVAWALEHLPVARPAVLADLGTGSGAIALALAQERPLAEVHAVENSAAALAVARANAQRLGLGGVRFVEADFLRWLASARGLDLIVSNPPYIAAGDAHLAALRHEPAAALVAGPDGLACLRGLIAAAPLSLRRGGRLLLEHGYDQGPPVRALLAAAGFTDIHTRRDLAGHERLSGGTLA